MINRSVHMIFEPSGQPIPSEDKARALVEELRQWQKEGSIDPNYNARVMYDELNKILTLPFSYPGFRKYYNK